MSGFGLTDRPCRNCGSRHFHTRESWGRRYKNVETRCRHCGTIASALYLDGQFKEPPGQEGHDWELVATPSARS